MVKVSVAVLYPKSFCALIVTCLPVTDADGVPEMTPVFVFNVSPEGNDPDGIENTTDSPVNAGVIENDALLGMVYEE